MRPVIGPNQILSIPAEFRGRSAPVAVRQLLILLLENLFSQFGVGNYDIESRTEPHRDDWPVRLGPFGEAAEPYGLDVVEVSDDRQGAGPRWEAVTEVVVEVMKEEDDRYGEQENEEGESHGRTEKKWCFPYRGHGGVGKGRFGHSMKLFQDYDNTIINV